MHRMRVTQEGDDMRRIGERQIVQTWLDGFKEGLKVAKKVLADMEVHYPKEFNKNYKQATKKLKS